MKTTPYTETYNIYSSDVCPEVQTRDEKIAEIIRWADSFAPVVWKIITSNKSQAFGKNSSLYVGWSQGSDSSRAILERLVTFYRNLQADEFGKTYSIDSYNMHVWSVNFTLEHFEEKGFTGGFFKQWDGKYDRGCAFLDYTPETLPTVIEHFIAWCGSTFETKAVKVDKQIVWTAP